MHFRLHESGFMRIISRENNGSRLTGFIRIELVDSPFSGERTGHIVYTHVSNDYIRMGIAQALLSTAEKKLMLEKIPGMALNVRGNNSTARNLYEKNGFSVERLRITKSL